MNALLNIYEYFIEEIRVRVNEGYKDPDNDGTPSEVTTSISIKRRGTESDFMISMKIELNRSKKAFAASPYYIFLSITGYFSFSEEAKEETIKKMIGINGPVILYGVARGVIAQATGNCRHGKFVLPTVNFLEVLKNQAKKAMPKTRTKKVIDS